MAEVLILSGPPGAGKSTVGEALAERYDRVAHIDVNQVRRFVTAGRVPPWRGGPERERQHRLAVRNAAALARNFLAEAIGVIIDDLVDAEALEWYLAELREAGAPVHLVRLMPSLAACEARDAGRKEGSRAKAGWVETVWRRFHAEGEFAGGTVDSTTLSVYEAADRVQELTTAGRSLVWRPGAATPAKAPRDR
jgi:chloramphenicol 3-O-phosphotransferase